MAVDCKLLATFGTLHQSTVKDLYSAQTYIKRFPRKDDLRVFIVRAKYEALSFVWSLIEASVTMTQ